VGRWLTLAALLLVAACSDDSTGGGSGDVEQSVSFAGKNLILISIDTLRTDATGFSGGAEGLTDALDALAERSIVFTQARANAPQTAPSHMSLFTGVAPSVHGVQNVQHGVDPKTGKKRPLIESVPAEIPTLAESLRAAGYTTVGLTDGGNLNPPHGFMRGFDEFTYQLSGGEAQVADGVDRLASLRATGGTHFLFLHTYQVHAPYAAATAYLERWADDDYHGPMRERVDQVAAMPFAEAFGSLKTLYWKDKESFGKPEADYLHGVYKAGVAETDDLLVPFLDALESSGALDDSIVIVLSDHGEEFLEHGRWQHDQLYEECLRVPLMIHLPGDVGAGRSIDVPVGLMDLMPTLLELLDVKRTTGDDAVTVRVPMRGRSLASHLVDGSTPRPEPILSEYRADRPGSPLYDWQIAIHHQGRKFLWDQYRQTIWWGEGKAPQDWRDHYLFDLSKDAAERTNLARTGDPLVANFREQLDDYMKELEALEFLERLDAGGQLTAEQLEQLKQLGYIQEDG
jgi:arylsulfatase A-like enzyme